MLSLQSLLFLALLSGSSSVSGVTASAVARESARPAVAGQQHPLITPSPASWDPTKTYKRRRDIFDDLKNKAKEQVGEVLSELGNVPSYVASGIPNFFQDLPGADKVQSSLGLDDDQVAALPTQVLNVP